MVDASLLQGVSTLHVIVTVLSVWQGHTASVCDVYSATAVDSCIFVYFGRLFRAFATPTASGQVASTASNTAFGALYFSARCSGVLPVLFAVAVAVLRMVTLSL